MTSTNPYAHGINTGNRSFHRGDRGFTASILVFPSGALVAVLPEEMLDELAGEAGWKPGLWPEDAA